MRKYIFIGAGGFVGAIARYLIRGVRLFGYSGLFPLSTLIINVSGAFLLALLMTAASDRFKADEELRLGLTVGFLGAYTTFSTLCRETVALLESGSFLTAFLYVAASVLLGLASAYLGSTFARGIGRTGKADASAESDVG